ncbi:MAG: hypothetical protein A3F72_18060 [Bacteroidetes bacterium RIFCSPLOWO2_12_FULL_35_15]|nr:MAG: hypothetical protein A3F72_18060 [Bacteroidetes bacterium RIFCSPLOWO2_12_FULL_35_15]
MCPILICAQISNEDNLNILYGSIKPISYGKDSVPNEYFNLKSFIFYTKTYRQNDTLFESTKDSIIWMYFNKKQSKGKIKLITKDTLNKRIDFTIESENNIIIPYGVRLLISTKKFPNQTWNLQTLSKTDSSFAIKFVNRKKMEIEKKMEFSKTYTKDILKDEKFNFELTKMEECGIMEAQNIFYVKTLYQGEFLIVNYLFPYFEDEFVPYAISIFKRIKQNEKWELFFENLDSASPYIDLDNDGVPELIGGNDYDNGIWQFYKNYKSIIRDGI